MALILVMAALIWILGECSTSISIMTDLMLTLQGSSTLIAVLVALVLTLGLCVAFISMLTALNLTSGGLFAFVLSLKVFAMLNYYPKAIANATTSACDDGAAPFIFSVPVIVVFP